jgi:tRNA threonylcarbamoyladenosine biosynthesis protein TsaB
LATLAINTAGNFVSVGLLNGMNVVSQLDSRNDFHPSENAVSSAAGANDQLPPGYTKKRSKRGQSTRRVFPPGASVMLAPLIQQILSRQGILASDLDLICVAVGPGIFTGLRVGVVTAKALAYATKAKLVAVNTLDAIAAQTYAEAPEFDCKDLYVAVNAQRQQLFVNHFQVAGEWQVEKCAADQLVDRQQFVRDLPPQAAVTGPGLAPLVDSVAKIAPTVEVIETDLWELTAASVGRLGTAMFDNGHQDDHLSIKPIYFRPSAADEKLGQRK